MTNDTIADLLTRIRNAQTAHHSTVLIPRSKMVERVLNVLQAEGYVDSFEEVNQRLQRTGHSPVVAQYKVFLRYDEQGHPVISELKRVSKPGRRVYASGKEIPQVRCGLGISVVSTSRGVMTDRNARKEGIGGEILASVF